jgi:two-component system LytT family response regulator
MRTLLVDDEPLARQELRRLLAPYGWIDIVGEAANADQARQMIEKLAPVLLFLDIQMPGGTGFDLLAQLDRPPRVIFTTAYDHYAVQAFEVSALDYLLKPVEPKRLAAALAKLQSDPRLRTAEAQPLEQLFVRDGPRCWFVPLREVSLLSAEGNYVRLNWGSERPLLARSLVALEEKLAPQQFFRANRQQILNIDFIEKIQPAAGGCLRVGLRGSESVKVSRRQSRLFRAIMTI